MPFGRRSSIPTNKQSQPYQPASKPTRDTEPENRWDVLVRQHPRITDPGPLATINQNVLVIGIGTFGGYVLERLAARLEDVNANEETPKPKLLYLRMPNATGQPEIVQPHPFVDLIELTEDNRAPDVEDLAKPHWAWLKALGYQPGEAVHGRQAARTVLFKHLHLGPELSQLIPRLNFYLRQRPSHIFLVASAYEVVGAGLIGDLAALVRCCTPNSYIPLIDALVLTESANARPQEEDAYLAATLYELGRLTVEGRPRISYTAARDTLLHYPPQSDDMQLLSGLGLILGNNDAGVQQTAMLLWGTLIAPQFLTEFHAALTTRPIENRLIPSVSLVFAHALVRPLSLLAQIFMHKLTYDLIGRQQQDRLPPRSNQLLTRTEIDEVIEARRQSGLWPSVYALQQMEPDNRYFGEIASALRDQLTATSHALNDIRQQIISFCSSHRTLAYDVPVALDDWLDQPYPPERLEDLRRQLGLAANPAPPPPFYLLIAPERSGGRPISLIAQDRRDVENEWMPWIRLLAKHEAWTTLKAQETLFTFHRVLEQRQYESLQQRWQTRVPTWLKDVQAELEGLEFSPRGKLFYLNVPEKWQANTFGDIKVIRSEDPDPTFALQVWVIQPIPLSNLRRVREAKDLQSYLVHDVEGLVLSIFGADKEALLHVPVALQNALPYQQTLQRFFEFWYDGQAYRLRRTFQGATLSWDQALSDFIAKHEEDQYLASHERFTQMFFELLHGGVLEEVDPYLPPNADWLSTVKTFILHAQSQPEVLRRIAYVREHAEAAYVWGDLRRIAKVREVSLTIHRNDDETSAEVLTLRDLIAGGLEPFVERYERDNAFRQVVANCTQEYRGVWLHYPEGGVFETYLAQLFHYYLNSV